MDQPNDSYIEYHPELPHQLTMLKQNKGTLVRHIVVTFLPQKQQQQPNTYAYFDRPTLTSTYFYQLHWKNDPKFFHIFQHSPKISRYSPQYRKIHYIYLDPITAINVPASIVPLALLIIRFNWFALRPHDVSFVRIFTLRHTKFAPTLFTFKSTNSVCSFITFNT